MVPARPCVLLACLLAGAHGAASYGLEAAADSDALAMQLSDTLAMQLSAAMRTPPTTAVNETDENCTNETIPWLQIGFAMDCTGSTGAYLAALKTTVGNLATQLSASVTTLQMAFLCYRDEGDVSPPRYEWATHPNPLAHWFTDPVQLQAAIAPFYSGGGGDSPEDNAGAMGQMLNNKPWDPSAVKVLIVISKDRDSQRTPYQTDALQCTLMQDIRAAGINLILGHLDTSTTSSMLWDSTYKPTLPWKGCYADPSDPHQLKEIQFSGVTATEFSALLIEEICDTISTEPTDPTAVGDPHLVNMLGEHFDIMRAGRYKLLHIPRDADKRDLLLAASADVVRYGHSCDDMYFTAINITGQWSLGHKNTTFVAGAAPPKTSTGWVDFGTVSLKVVHGRTVKATPYLNFFARRVQHAGYSAGGLLGDGDHTKAETPDKECQNHMSLLSSSSVLR